MAATTESLPGKRMTSEPMPDVRTSSVLERGDGRAVIEQEAVAHFMMFSKRVHLVLEVQEEAGSIRFRDRWTQREHRSAP